MWLLLIFCGFSSILFLLVHYFFLLYFKAHVILFPFLTPFCHHLSNLDLCFKNCFLPFLDFLFPTLIIIPHSSFSKSSFSPLVTSYSFFLSYNILNLDRSSQDGGIGRNASLPSTTKRRITINLKKLITRTARKSNCMELQ